MRIAPLLTVVAVACLALMATAVTVLAVHVLQGAVVLLGLVAGALDHTTML